MTPAVNSTQKLRRMIASGKARICVVGLGYVGVPLTVASARAGFNVVGVDIDAAKVDSVNAGVSHVEDPYSERFLSAMVKNGKLKATRKLEDGAESADVIIVCVQTPLDTKGKPDLSYLKSVSRRVARLQRSRYRLIIIESTSYPGTTKEIVYPILHDGLGRNFSLVYSPERIDYGNPKYNVSKIPKVVGGIDPESTSLGARFYESILDAPVFKVSDPSVAEASKILENIFRYVNIALVNELAVLHEKLGVDFVETVAAAATKPFGFMPHYPGPGVGGHCIPKDPFYLVYKAKSVGIDLQLVASAETINTAMPKHTVARLENMLRAKGKGVSDATIALWGLSYKGQVKDTRRSPAVEMLKLLLKSGANVRVYDPFVPSVLVGGNAVESTRNLGASVEGADCILIATTHKAFGNADLKKLVGRMKKNPIMFDSRNMLSRDVVEKAGFQYLGTGRP